MDIYETWSGVSHICATFIMALPVLGLSRHDLVYSLPVIFTYNRTFFGDACYGEATAD